MAERTAVVGLSDLSHNCCGALLSEPPRHPATDILKRLSGLPLRAPSAPLMHRWVCLWATFTLSDYVSRPTLYTACRPSQRRVALRSSVTGHPRLAGSAWLFY